MAVQRSVLVIRRWPDCTRRWQLIKGSVLLIVECHAAEIQLICSLTVWSCAVLVKLTNDVSAQRGWSFVFFSHFF